MTTFDEREHAYEAKFAHDEELRFKAEARRNRLLGEWAADLLGKTGDARAEYAKAVVASDFEEAGDEDVFRKVSFDLEGKADAATIRAKMAELRATARQQIIAEA
ncbi:DUF1476 domain-containing protein [Paracoccus sp. p4-l81]|uniref:DUF1476 domain-containing protein n=1 Tax=Paracoccus sp. p4-l81 TaxID=3342806 RepID=UPI0035B6CF69